jgi:hypothetical protein
MTAHLLIKALNPDWAIFLDKIKWKVNLIKQKIAIVAFAKLSTSYQKIIL